MLGAAARRIAMVVEYDGARYAGFQRQAKAPSIQAELERAITRLTLESVRVQGAGRTDSGVHALGQVVAFTTSSQLPCGRLMAGTSHFLPKDIAVKAAYDVRPDFDPRRSARSRVYRYSMFRGAAPSPLRERYAFRVPEELDVVAMGVALRYMEGEHDFAALGSPVAPGKRTVRHVYCAKLQEEEPLIHLEVEANAFLPHQMRRMAGLVLAVGSGRLCPEAVPATLAGQDHPWQIGRAKTLPARGLCLMQVNYKDFPPNGYETHADL